MNKIFILAVSLFFLAIPQVYAEKKVKDKTGSSLYKDMALIPAGEFTMGYDHRWDDEKPAHKRKTGKYYLDKYEVTNQDYEKFVKETNRKLPNHWQGNSIPAGLEKHPVIYVDWYDAEAYCQWKGKRLPTEPEWEKGARGTDGREFPYGNDFNIDYSNNPQKGSTGTEPVGSYEKGKSPYGLYDMSGNVWEWVDGWYLPHPVKNKPNEEFGKKYRVVKGGSWYDCSFYACGISAYIFNRGFFTPETKNHSFGFRCAADPKK